MKKNGRLSETVFQLEQSLKRHQGMHPTVRKAIGRMLARDECCTNETRLALAIGCSQRTLRERFRAHVGLSPMAFRRRLALVESLRWLAANPHASIDEVAQQVGYRHARSLARMWVNAVDVTPAKAARALRELHCQGRIGSLDGEDGRATSWRLDPLGDLGAISSPPFSGGRVAFTRQIAWPYFVVLNRWNTPDGCRRADTVGSAVRAASSTDGSSTTGVSVVGSSSGGWRTWRSCMGLVTRREISS